MDTQQPNNPKVLVVGIIHRSGDIPQQKASLTEAISLVDTYGGVVVKVVTQYVNQKHSSTLLGSGKIKTITKLVAKSDIDIVVINHHLHSGQLYTLTQQITVGTDCLLWDRTQLILQIFKKHAHTTEAKLQIQLAELEHKGPELSGIGESMSQQKGGIGTRGIGETQTERMKRHWHREKKVTKKKLVKVTKTRQQQMKHRKRSGIPTISIIGYTNAGKTTLFNALTTKHDLVEDALFATLDSSISHIYLKKLETKVYISDTIGFIQDLPTMVIDAFKSTLLETLNADILLHIIDSTDVNLYQNISTVDEILTGLDLVGKPQIKVFNKIDLLPQDSQQDIFDNFQDDSTIFISASTKQGVDVLISTLENRLKQQQNQVKINEYEN